MWPKESCFMTDLWQHIFFVTLVNFLWLTSALKGLLLKWPQAVIILVNIAQYCKPLSGNISGQKTWCPGYKINA